jgi:hypothetical protein
MIGLRERKREEKNYINQWIKSMNKLRLKLVQIYSLISIIFFRKMLKGDPRDTF